MTAHATTARRLLLLAALAAGPAEAGPWLRDEGATYLSFGFEAPQDGDSWASLYAEHGLRERLTLGVIAGRSAARQEGEALVFARRPVGGTEGPWRAAVELGFGARFDEGGRTAPALRIGASIGRGFETRWGPGWAALDASATAAMRATALGVGDWRDLEPVAKLEATLGVRPTQDSAATLQLFYSQEGEDEPAIRLVPSYARRIRGETFGRVGVVIGAGAAPRLAVELGLTTSF